MERWKTGERWNDGMEKIRECDKMRGKDLMVNGE
jgi:hypothetical protein